MLLPLFEKMQESWVAAYFLNNTWSSPIVQCIHLVALVVFSGAILVLDVRLLGRGLTKIPVAKLSKDMEPWLIGGFVTLAITGLPMMMSTAFKQYYSPFFWRKMVLLTIALVFTFTIRRWVARGADVRFGPVWPKVVGLLSIGMWTTVAVWARLIGLLS